MPYSNLYSATKPLFIYREFYLFVYLCSNIYSKNIYEIPKISFSCEIKETRDTNTFHLSYLNKNRFFEFKSTDLALCEKLRERI